jgi:predicted nuclease with TOPRIM domain
MSEETKTFIAELISDLKQQRDELRVRIHLGSAELKDEMSKLDDKLAQLSQRFEPVKDAVEDTAEDVWESLKLVGGEIKEGFKRIRKSL